MTSPPWRCRPSRGPGSTTCSRSSAWWPTSDLKANPNREAYGTIIESKVDKGRGNVATVLVQTGTLKVGDIVTVGKTSGRVRPPERGRPTGKAGRAGDRGRDPRSSDLPRPGTCCGWWPTRSCSRRRRGGRAPRGEFRRGSLEDISAQIQAAEVKELRVILKTDVRARWAPSATHSMG